MTAEIVQYHTPNLELLKRLLPIARRIFSEAFSHNYDVGPFQAYCDETYALDGTMSRDFTAGVHWRVATANDSVIGYAKVTSLRAPAPDPAPGAMELQQLYVLSTWHGRGVADALMSWALDLARSNSAPEVYLTVFDHNERAKRFYSRYGFCEVGCCTFQLGDRIDDDRIWRALI